MPVNKAPSLMAAVAQVRYGSTDPIQQLIETAEAAQVNAITDNHCAIIGTEKAHRIVRHIVRLERISREASMLYRKVDQLDNKMRDAQSDFAEDLDRI